MRIIGCDLHAGQQTMAMLDTATGEIVKMTLKHEGNNVREFYPRFPARCWWGSKPQDRCDGFEPAWKSWESMPGGHPATIREAEPRKQKHDRRDAELILKLLAKIGFRRSGCPRKSCGICGPCCCTVISGCACGRGYKMRCRRSPWRMVYSADPLCGVETATGDRVVAAGTAHRLSAERIAGDVSAVG